MGDSLTILVVSDGKAGHENQSVGLAEALARRTAVESYCLLLEGGGVSKIRRALESSRQFPRPDLVIGAGHSTHLALLVLARKDDARSIVLMKPMLPMRCFDWCVVPEHDFTRLPESRRVIVSRGALNRVVPTAGERRGRLILVGGPSKNHGYDERGLIDRIRALSPGEEWEVADSRRTPGAFREAFAKEFPGLRFVPHEETGPGWLAERLASAAEVWVTEDSVSMVYEALTGGGRVGVLDMPRLRVDARVVRGIEKLKSEGCFTAGSEGDRSPIVLAEADRCAELILSRR